MSGAPLRLGLLVDSLAQPHWVAATLDEIRRAGDAEIVLVIRNAAPAPPPAPLWRRVLRSRSYWSHLAYTTLDDRTYGEADDAFALRDLTASLAGAPVVDVVPRQTKFSDFFEPPDVARIRDARLDVALRLGFRILRGAALTIARHGVWSFHHGDNRVNRGGPAGYWEVVQDAPVTGAVLQVLGEELDGGGVIARSWSPTDRRSVRRNRNGYYWSAAALLPRSLRALRVEGALPRPTGDPVPAFEPYGDRLYRMPANAESLHASARILGRWGREKLGRITHREQWQLAFAIGKPGAPVLHRFRAMIPPPHRFFADPFPVPDGDRWQVFLEDAPMDGGRAHIAVCEIARDGTWSPPRLVLERPYHLSYPFVLDWDGERWMIPETSENRTVELYRCVSFPDRWELERVLLEGVSAADATVMPWQGGFVMFTCVSRPGLRNMDSLHLFFAESLLGPWRPGRANPVKVDVRSARPAGRPFELNGHWIRPAQDCSGRYGRAIGFQRIVRLDESGYEEQEIARIDPRWAPDVLGTHTYNTAGELTIVDCERRRRRG